MPPSKAHLKQLARDRSDAFKAPERGNVKVSQAELFRRAQIIALRQISGPAWVAPEPVQREAIAERGVERPLTPEQLCQRAAQLKAEFHRLARYCDHSDDWHRRRKLAFEAWQKAEAACG